MSEHSAAPDVSESAPAATGRFAFLSRLLQRLKKQKPAESAPAAVADAAEATARPAGRFAFIANLLAGLRKSKTVVPDAEAAAESDSSSAGDAVDVGVAPPGRLKRLFDSPIKIALAGASLLLLLMVIALIVVLVVKKKPKSQPSATLPLAGHQAASGKAKPVAGHAELGSVDATKRDKPATMPGAHPANDPLAEERVRLEQMKTDLEKQRQQLEQDRKALAEQAGHATNGSVIGRSGSGAAANIAGSCDLSGNKQSLRENLRRCLGLPDKKPDEPTKPDAVEQPAAAPAPKAAGGH